MKNLIDYTYFKGPVSLPQMSQDYVRESLNDLISECQKYLLEHVFTDQGSTVEYILNSKRCVVLADSMQIVNNDIDIFYASNLNYVTSEFLQEKFNTKDEYLYLTKISNIPAEVTLSNLINKSNYTSSDDNSVRIGLHVFKDGLDVGYVYIYKEGLRTMVHMEQPLSFDFTQSDVVSDVFDMTVDYSLFQTTDIKISIEPNKNVLLTGFNIGSYFVAFSNFEKLREKFLTYIREVLTNLVYCVYLYDMDVKVTQSGTAKGESENSKRVSPVQKHVTRWNINVNLLKNQAHEVFKYVFVYRYNHVNKFNTCSFCTSSCECSCKKNILYNYKNSLGL